MALSDTEDKCQEPSEPLCKGINCEGSSLDPKGFCLAGYCICNNQWHGKFCEESLVPPRFENSSLNLVVFETDTLEKKLPVANGSKPISYTLENEPLGLTLSRGNTIQWSNMTPGSYAFLYKAINKAGNITMKIKLDVSSCYITRLTNMFT